MKDLPDEQSANIEDRRPVNTATPDDSRKFKSFSRYKSRTQPIKKIEDLLTQQSTKTPESDGEAGVGSRGSETLTPRTESRYGKS